MNGFYQSKSTSHFSCFSTFFFLPVEALFADLRFGMVFTVLRALGGPRGPQRDPPKEHVSDPPGADVRQRAPGGPQGARRGPSKPPKGPSERTLAPPRALQRLLIGPQTGPTFDENMKNAWLLPVKGDFAHFVYCKLFFLDFAGPFANLHFCMVFTTL